LYLGAFAESIPERRRLFIAGLFLGLALAQRPPLAPTIILAVIALSRKNWPLRLTAITAGVLAPVVLFGIVDAFTWSYPFQSFLAFFKFNVLQKSGVQSGNPWFVEHEWIRPWYWFVPALGLRLGPMALLAMVGARRSPFLAWVALVILLTHSVVGHKEFRFIYPIIPLAITLSGLGLADVLAALRSRWKLLRSAAAACTVGLVLCVCASAVLARFFPLWSRHSGILMAFQSLSRDAKLCGLGLVGGEVDPTVSGGYTYLHRDVSIYFLASVAGGDMPRLVPSFDAVVTAAPLAYDGFVKTRCWSGTCLYRRPGSCVRSPADEVRFIPVE
jgi:hypothetical protein